MRPQLAGKVQKRWVSLRVWVARPGQLDERMQSGRGLENSRSKACEPIEVTNDNRLDGLPEPMVATRKMAVGAKGSDVPAGHAAGTDRIRAALAGVSR